MTAGGTGGHGLRAWPWCGHRLQRCIMAMGCDRARPRVAAVPKGGNRVQHYAEAARGFGLERWLGAEAVSGTRLRHWPRAGAVHGHDVHLSGGSRVRPCAKADLGLQLWLCAAMDSSRGHGLRRCVAMCFCVAGRGRARTARGLVRLCCATMNRAGMNHQ